MIGINAMKKIILASLVLISCGDLPETEEEKQARVEKERKEKIENEKKAKKQAEEEKKRKAEEVVRKRKELENINARDFTIFDDKFTIKIEKFKRVQYDKDLNDSTLEFDISYVASVDSHPDYIYINTECTSKDGTYISDNESKSFNDYGLKANEIQRRNYSLFYPSYGTNLEKLDFKCKTGVTVRFYEKFDDKWKYLSKPFCIFVPFLKPAYIDDCSIEI